MRNPLLILAGLLAAGFLAACSDTIKSPDFVPELQELRVCETVGGSCPSPSACFPRPANAPSTVPVGRTLQLCALGRYEGLNSPDDNIFVADQWRNLTDDVAWSAESGAAGLLTVDASGLVTGVNQSLEPLDVIATVPGALSSSTQVRVTDPVLDSVEINPAGILGPFLAGTSRSFNCFAQYSGDQACAGQVDPQTCNVTQDSNFASSDATIHSINNTDDKGSGTALAEGITDITCSFGGQQSNTAQVRVCDTSNITSLDIVPATLDPLPQGGSTQLSLIATYTNCFGTGELTADVTEQATWTSGNTDAATVEGGLVSAIAPGTAEVTGEFGGETASVTVVVADANLVRIEAMGPTTILAGINASAEYTAQAIFVDPDTQEELDPVDITMGPDTFWSSTAPMTLAFPDIHSGSAIIDQAATPQTLTVQVDYLGQTGTLEVNLVLGTLQSIEIVPDLACVGATLSPLLEESGQPLGGPQVPLEAFALVSYTDSEGAEQSCSTIVTDAAEWVPGPSDLTSDLLGGLLGGVLADVTDALVGDCAPDSSAPLDPLTGLLTELLQGTDPVDSPIVVTNAGERGIVSENPAFSGLASGACVYSSFTSGGVVATDFASVLVVDDLQSVCAIDVLPLLANTTPSVTQDCADITDPQPAAQ